MCLLAAAGCRTAPVHNVARSAFAKPVEAAPANVGEAIWAAGRAEGWRVREVGPGELRAEKSLRTHRALVAIRYDAGGFGITLLEADDLMYDGRRVHEAYNEWVDQLEKRIQQEVRFRFQ
jgi:hypothetical protein